MKFTANQFTPTAHSSAEEKAKFANHFVRFVQSGFKETLFYDWFYTRLSMTFGHIAHYNRGGFYETQCNTIAQRLRFLEQGVQWPAYGSPAFTYCDVELALAGWIEEQGLIEDYRKQLATAIEASERAQLARLSAKYA